MSIQESNLRCPPAPAGIEPITAPREVDTQELLRWAICGQFRKGDRTLQGVRGMIKRYWHDESSGQLHAHNVHADAMVIARILSGFDRLVAIVPPNYHGEHGITSSHDDKAKWIIDGLEFLIDEIDAAAAFAAEYNLFEILVGWAFDGRAPPNGDRTPKPHKTPNYINRHPLVLREDADGNLMRESLRNRRHCPSELVGNPRCPLLWAPDPKEILKDRIEYFWWWDAHRRLFEALENLPPSQRLISCIPTRLARSQYPWRKGRNLHVASDGC